MKQITTTFLILALVLSCCACSTSSINNYETLPTIDHSESDITTAPADGTDGTDTTDSATEPVTEPSTEPATEPVTEPTTEPATEPVTEPSTESTDIPSTDVTPTEPTTPTPSAPSACKHNYQLVSMDPSTCIKNGQRVFHCTICGDGYYRELPLVAHQFTDATCTAPKTCSVCGSIQGEALGHNFNKGSCVNCGAADPTYGPVEFIVNVKADDGTRKSGVTVHVYTDESPSVAVGSSVTNSNGTATITLPAPSDHYKVILSDIPSGYSGKEFYTFTSTRVNLTLTTLSVITPDDHSKAKYKVGSTMGDFTLTDVDGVTHNLSDLLKEKKLIVLNFWYTDCNPCKAEFPYFESLYSEYKDEMALLALDPIGVDSNEDIAQVKADLDLSFPMMRETLGMAAGFGVTYYPTTVFIDGSGRILEIHTGSYSSETELRARIEYYL